MAIKKLLNIPFETNVLYEEGSSSSGHGFGNVPAESISLFGGEAETVVDAEGISVGGAKVSFPKGGGEFATSVIEKTWAELRAMKAGGGLVPGQQYRITDYVATTNGDMGSVSAGNRFDIIVVADSENKLNEKARAIRHSGDVYFPEETKFESWLVWYCLENDSTRFLWAVSDDNVGKGVIYRLVDEFGNDCPYDFKGIKFNRWAITDVTSNVLTQEQIDFLKVDLIYGGSNLAWQDSNIGVRGSGNLLYTLVVESSSVSSHYTFDNGSGVDSSLAGFQFSDSAYGNVIRPYVKLVNNLVYKNSLNNIVFMSRECNKNVFYAGCHSNTFVGQSLENVFGEGCCFNWFLSGEANTFGGNCSTNVVSGNRNTFGRGCTSNVLSETCDNNIFGNGCVANVLGNSCYENVFADSCEYNSAGNYCENNVFEGFCNHNVIGESCSYNVFGWGSNRNTFGITSESPYSYYEYITFELGVSSVNLVCTDSNMGSRPYRNVTVATGVNSVIINDSNINQNYKTTYEAHGSQTIDVSTLA